MASSICADASAAHSSIMTFMIYYDDFSFPGNYFIHIFLYINMSFSSPISYNFWFGLQFCIPQLSYGLLFWDLLMASGGHNFVSEITPVKESLNIDVRVIRLWFVPDMNVKQKFFAMEMVLMDEKVNCCYLYSIFIYLIRFN